MGADSNGVTITAEHIYNKICDKCDRPALTFDRDHRAMCPKHAAVIIRAEPVRDELLVNDHLSG
jgi:hypothetical protein